MNSHDISLFPPQRVPTEIWTEIFDLCAPIEDLSDETTAEQEKERLSKNYLIQFSQLHGTRAPCSHIPGLRSLAVKGRFEDPAYAIWWDRDALLPFIFRSKLGSSLRFLEVSRVLITADELLECLQNLPLLEDLLLSEGNDDLDDFFITDDLLVGLVVVDLVPRLTFLCLTSHIVFSEQSLEQLVLGRVRRPVQAETTGDFDLKVFHLPESLGALSTELLERMQNLERETEFEFQF
ncbi:unnamed protein product, partial [Mycena citricolor]